MTNRRISSKSNARRVAFLALAVGTPLFVRTAAAQETLTTESQLLASAPERGSSAASITFGLKIEDGRTETRGYSTSGTWARATMGGTVLRLDGKLTRAEYRPPTETNRITVDDAQRLSISLVRPLKGRISLIGSGEWSRDVPVGLDHRLLVQGGFGLTVHRANKLLFTAGPLIGFGNQNNSASPSTDRILNLGGTQSLSWKVTPTFGIESTATAHKDVDNGDDYSVKFDISGTARVTSRLGMKVSYSYAKEGIHPANVDAVQTRLEFGATLTLTGG